MQQRGSDIVLSATDLSTFLACRHRTALEMSVLAGVATRPYVEDPLLELLWKRGADHEKRYVDALRAAGRRVVDLGAVEPAALRLTATAAAMHEGADIIVQGALADGRWFGKPD